MAAKTYPEGYKKADVALDTVEGPDGDRVLYMRDNLVFVQEGGTGPFMQRASTPPVQPPAPPAPKMAGDIVDGHLAVANVRDETKPDEALHAEIHRLRNENAALKAAQRGQHEGRPQRHMKDVQTAPRRMAGKYPHKTDEMPTLDEVNGVADEGSGD